MLLLETDGKHLFRKAGITTPHGVRLRSANSDASLPGKGPWIAKAQVPAGGRGKAGGVRKVAERGELASVLSALLGLRIKGCETHEVLVEEMSSGEEHYLAIMVDAGAGGVRLIYTPRGGVDVESHAPEAGVGFNELLPLDAEAIATAVERLSACASVKQQAGLRTVASRLSTLFLNSQLMLAEINPLFTQSDGSFVAGDAKVVLDMNALSSQPELQALLRERRDLYPDAWRKLAHDFDFVEIDPQGQVGLITTGAGLSMMLIDELAGQGLSPFNFCDMRTGQMRGNPARLLQIIDWLAEAQDVRVVLVNIFAGITDLAEFAQLLADALQQRPHFRLPVVARLVGNGEAAARHTLDACPDLHVLLEPDLEKAIAHTVQLLAQSAQRSAAPEVPHVI